MRVIYLDVLIGVNLAMDYLLLCATSKMSGIYCTRLRLFFGSVVGALYAALSCLVPYKIFISLPTKIIISCVMIFVSFGRLGKNRFLRLLMLFLGICFAAAGAVLALGNVSDTSFFAGGGYYIDIPFRVVAATMVISWVVTGYIFRSSASDKVSPRKTVRAKFIFQNHQAEFTLLVDTGNTLHEPISGKPVIILDRTSASKLLPVTISTVLNRLHTENAADILSYLPESYKHCFRLVPFHAVGKKSGLLLAFKPDCIMIDDKSWHGLVAINAEHICGGQYQGLIGL